jgi:hypothetical protein
MVSNYSHSSIAWSTPAFDKISASPTIKTNPPLSRRTHDSPYKQAVLILFEGPEGTRTLLYAEHLRWFRLASMSALYRQEADMGHIGSKYNTNIIRRGPPPFFMGRPKKPISERKIVASFTLHPATIVILDNLAVERGATRSDTVDRMIKREGLSLLGLSALEGHTAQFQTWPTKYEKGKVVSNGNACPPNHVKGECQHSHCQSVYKKEGLI